MSKVRPGFSTSENLPLTSRGYPTRISPPLVGGDKGEGGPDSSCPPPPLPPIEGGGVWSEKFQIRLDRFEKLIFLVIFFMLGLFATQCATVQEETHVHGETSVKTYPKDYVHPLKEINFEKVVQENRGLKILEENATTVHDYYRGGVQEKAEGEILLKEGKWEQAEAHLEKSNWFLRVVLRYLPEDEAYRNIYGDHVVIFLPNLLSADNYLKLVTIYRKMGRDDKAAEAMKYGKDYLSLSLKHVKTEWAFRVQKDFEEALPRK